MLEMQAEKVCNSSFEQKVRGCSGGALSTRKFLQFFEEGHCPFDPPGYATVSRYSFGKTM